MILLILFFKTQDFIHKYYCKNHLFFYSNKKIYYKPLKIRSFLLKDDQQKTLLFYNHQQINNFYKVMTPHGVQGWVVKNKLPLRKELLIWYKPEKTLGLIKDVELLGHNQWKITLFYHKNQGKGSIIFWNQTITLTLQTKEINQYFF